MNEWTHQSSTLFPFWRSKYKSSYRTAVLHLVGSSAKANPRIHLVLPMPVGSPWAPGVVGISRVGGLRVHGDGSPTQAAGRRKLCPSVLSSWRRLTGSLRRLTEVASCRQSGLKATLGAPGEETSTWRGKGGVDKTEKFELKKRWQVWRNMPSFDWYRQEEPMRMNQRKKRRKYFSGIIRSITQVYFSHLDLF